MPFTLKRAKRKDIFVDFVQVTAENMEELAAWTKGEIKKTSNGNRYIDIDVLNPIELKQRRAFVGDFVLRSANGFKVYTERGFYKNFIVL